MSEKKKPETEAAAEDGLHPVRAGVIPPPGQHLAPEGETPRQHAQRMGLLRPVSAEKGFKLSADGWAHRG